MPRAGRVAWPCAALLAACGLAGCAPGVLDPAGPIALAERSILVDSLAIMLAIVLPTIAATLAFAWWYRESNTRARYRPDWAYSGRVELIVWAIPLLTITLLGGVAWIGSHELDPYKPIPSATPALEVQVVSLDWKWLFIYPAQHVASVNQLTVPAGVPVHFLLTSASVMNTFFVPQLGSMIYTMNGMQTQLYLQADKPGHFHGLSGHYSGDGFSDMHFEVAAVPPQDFAGWVASVRGHGPSLDAGSYAQLARQSIATAPFTYGQADPALFGRIVQQSVPAGPGPQDPSPKGAISPHTEK
jgi:cytochrome o ubiquinol oxidase subunit 2